MDVIVVGAGYAGLVAAYRLGQSGHKVTLIEASSRVGGRTLDHEVSGMRLELGGQYIAPEQHRVLGLIKELGLETYLSYGEGNSFFSFNGKVAPYKGSPAKCLVEGLGQPESIQEEIENGLKTLEQLFPQIPKDTPWTAPQAQFLDSLTFQTWLEATQPSLLVRNFFRFMTNQGFSTDPEEISLLQMLWFLNTSHGLPPWAVGGPQSYRIRGGTQLLAMRLAEKISGKILFNEPVLSIEQKNDRVWVHTLEKHYEAQAAIVCLPPQLLAQLRYDPILPADLFRAFSAFQIGNAMKVQAVYDRPFWRDKGWSGSGIIYEGPQTFTYDNSGPDGVPGVLLGFITASRATIWNRKSVEERKKAVLDAWAAVFGAAVLNPIEYVEMDWAQDPFIRGGHGCHLPPGVWCELGSALGGSHMPRFGRIFWAGSDLAKDWNGYLEGALFAGEQTALEVEEVLKHYASI